MLSFTRNTSYHSIQQSKPFSFTTTATWHFSECPSAKSLKCSQMLLQQCQPNLSLNHLFPVIHTHHHQFYHQHQNQTFHLLSDILDMKLDLQQSGGKSEWWKVRHPIPVVLSDSDSSDEEGDADFADFANAAHDLDPKLLREALACSDAPKWQEAAKLEMETHHSNGTWEFVDLPPGAKTIGSGWVFWLKCNADGSIEQYKARLVAKEYSQRPGFDYTEVFAPTFRYAAICTIIALAAVNDLHLCSVDISHAFLNGDLKETIYMRQAEGFHIGSSNQVYHLWKSLYGLKQAARQWNKKLHDTHATMGFRWLESNRSIYILIRGDVHIIIPIFIDDITFASVAINSAVKELSSHFKLHDLGPTSFLLGIEIIHNLEKHQISLSQCQYILDALECFNMSNCNPIGTPMDPGAHLSSSMSPHSPEEQKVMDKIPHLSAVGTLQYLATSTSPDISFTVGVLARFNSNPGI